MNPQHTVVTGNSVTVILDGKPYSSQKGDPSFAEVLQAVKEKRWDAIPALLSKGLAVQKWSKGEFVFKDNLVSYKGEQIPQQLSDRMVKMAAANDNPSFLLRFWEKLQKNPSKRSVDQLYGFLQQHNIPIDSEGNVLAYKYVSKEYRDTYSGKFDNKPGVTNEMPRNKISDDPREACKEGLTFY